MTMLEFMDKCRNKEIDTSALDGIYRVFGSHYEESIDLVEVQFLNPLGYKCVIVKDESLTDRQL